MSILYVNFRQNLTPGQGVNIQERLSILDGRLLSVQVHWPNGCNGLVGVACWIGDYQFLPRNPAYLALNDCTTTYAIDEIIKVSSSVPLWVDLYNADAVNSHEISVVMGLEVKK